MHKYLLFLLLATQPRPMFAQDMHRAARQLQSDLSVWYSEKFHPPQSLKIIIFSPPLVVDSQLGSATISQTSALLLLTDTVPQPAPIYVNLGHTTFSVYKTILEYRQPESRALDKDQLHDLRKAERTLLRRHCPLRRLYWLIVGETPPREPSKEYLRYQQYSAACAVFRTRLNTTKDPGERAQLQAALDKSEHEWEMDGNKREVSDALASFRKIQSLNPESFWSDVNDQYYQNLIREAGSPLPNTYVVPPFTQWNALEGWISFQSGQSSGDIKFVDIFRPWMNPEVLGPRQWTWSTNTYGKNRVLLSDGKGFDTSDLQHQLMPDLPVQLLLARRFRSSNPTLSIDGPVIVGLVVQTLPRLPAEKTGR